ncbi:TPA: hypothetical protein N0F65_001991 [Lagenidium giganteum]|uniref:Uncharacterized protein n=1 Tax=Lagenidium giganteum TaxID=4803 RepID=A0AAV2Z3N3_9STRA|nr:TPA: hypothetical protein N0F65_001991 [Lagenidium giganteum]
MDVIIEEHTLSSEGGTAPPHGNNGRRSGKSNRSSHRRSQTIVAAGDLEMEQLEKHKEVEELHSELQFTSKALEESQEEAWLAARIGQTLLQRNHELDVESELKFVHVRLVYDGNFVASSTAHRLCCQTNQ